MSRTVLRTAPALALLAAGLAWVAPRVSSQAGSTPSTKSGDWTHYTADVRGSRYSPLDQINAANFNKLEVAWRFKTDNLGTRPEYKLEGTPLAVGIVYATGARAARCRARRRDRRDSTGSIAARRPRAVAAPRQLSGRGSRTGPTERRGTDPLVTTGYRLVALDAKTGRRARFGKNGIVDLKEGVYYGNRQPIDLNSGEIGLHSTPTVDEGHRDRRLVVPRRAHGQDPQQHEGARARFDVRNGKLLWTLSTRC